MERIQLNTLFCLLFFLIVAKIGNAQPADGWDQEKVRGEKYYIDQSYQGSPFYLSGWSEGTVIFESGNKLEGLQLKFDAYANQLISYNLLNNTMLAVDKTSVHGFVINDHGNKLYFEKRYFDGILLTGEHYFEILHDGDVDFICLRRIQLLLSSSYYDNTDELKKRKFTDSYRYFLVDQNQHFESISPKRSSILRYIPKAQKRQVKKLIRDNKLDLRIDYDFARALKIIEDNGLVIEM